MPTSPTSYHADLSAIGASAIEEMTYRSRAREEALSISRQVIRFSANAIRAVHRGELDEASRLITQAGQRLSETEPMRQANPEIFYAGFLSDARKEYAEANVTYAVISGGEIPGPDDLGMDPSPYLNGAAEAIGGITAENVAPVVEAGADAICVTAAVASAPEPEAAASRLVEAIRSAGGKV